MSNRQWHEDQAIGDTAAARALDEAAALQELAKAVRVYLALPAGERSTFALEVLLGRIDAGEGGQ